MTICHRMFSAAWRLAACLSAWGFALAPCAAAKDSAAQPAAAATQAAIHLTTRTIEYMDGETRLIGYLACDARQQGSRPGVLVVPEWWGLNAYARQRADQLARAGYVAFAADMYGEGRVTTDPAEAGKWAGAIKGSELIRTRTRVGLDQLAALKQVDPRRLGAIGFCFGGTAVLELAWSGAPVDAVASFHGSLTTPRPTDTAIQAGILVLHGANDDFETSAGLQAFHRALRARDLDWQMVYYGNAVHSFSNPGAGAAGIPGVAYEERAARRSWALMLDFFEEKLH